MAVFVLDKVGRPLMPCSEKRARLLLARGRARVHRLMPFAIRLVDRELHSSALQPLRIKLDPGSKATGLALVRDAEHVDTSTGEIHRGAVVLNLFELIHRGRQISEALTARRTMRRHRRSTLRYRAPRFLNRTRPAGWLPPSLQHRVDTTLAWVERLRCWAPIAAVSTELVRFDMQALDNPEVTGIEYQHGTLFGYELREYLLQKWTHKCCYCDAQNVPLNIEHLVPRARGGSKRVSNLAIACVACNVSKGARRLDVFVKDEARLARIIAQALRPLKDASAVNTTRWALVNALRATGVPVETASGGRTKHNRSQLGIPKTHALDAVCVGDVSTVLGWRKPTLQVKCTGRGSYQRTRRNKYGFPVGYLMRAKRVQGFGTGDVVRADVPTGKKAGTYHGRVAVRAKGNFNIQTHDRVVQGVAHRYCRLLQRADGYGYSRMATNKGEAGVGAVMRPAPSLPGPAAEVSRDEG
ncbi:RNA-guided endonuclease IscB [Paraburkholderia sp. 31.1]|uniref:RNA-guided endonuclease IscB n=1 Tax=unclassified Paraburkholderia TaxID=2615204 RepID=UPI0016562A41|nr:RNA-guided endonuclease IscB [Paraburkholderia sp. 31.1]MBC8722857.1 HNH endonuclease [Paraburkholderia sp. 31.1]